MMLYQPHSDNEFFINTQTAVVVIVTERQGVLLNRLLLLLLFFVCVAIIIIKAKLHYRKYKQENKNVKIQQLAQ